MAKRTYRLTCMLCLTGPEEGSKTDTVVVVANSTDEAVMQAEFYRSSLPRAAVLSSVLTDEKGVVVWTEQAHGSICEQ